MSKKLIQLLTLGFFLSQGFFISSAKAQKQTQTRKIIIAVLDDGNAHEKKIVKELQKLIKECKTCKIKTYPIYKSNGDLTTDQFINSLKKATQEADVLNFSWNITSDRQTAEIEKALQETAKTKIIAAAAGAPEGAKLRQPLVCTVIGKTKGLFIIGELNQQGRLHMHSYEGSKMLTALTPVNGESGSSFSVLKLTAAIAIDLAAGNTEVEIKKRLQNKKSEFPTLEELGFK